MIEIDVEKREFLEELLTNQTNIGITLREDKTIVVYIEGNQINLITLLIMALTSPDSPLKKQLPNFMQIFKSIVK